MSKEPKQSKTPKDPSKPPRMVTLRRKALVVSFLLSVVAVAVAYGVGRLQGWQTTRQAEATIESLQQGNKEASKECGAKLAAQGRRVERLEARRQLSIALLSLDERNFGIAEQHIELAAKLLRKSESDPQSELRAISEGLSKFRLVATENLAQQRETMFSWARRIDEVVPPPKL